MKAIIDKYFESILLLLGVIVSAAIIAWMLVTIVDRINDQNEVKENNNTAELIANIEACTEADGEDIKDCILLTIEDK